MIAFHAPPTGDLACNPGMCPNWESNQQQFGSQAGTQSTEPYQPGLYKIFLLLFNCSCPYFSPIVLPCPAHPPLVFIPVWSWDKVSIIFTHYPAIFSSIQVFAFLLLSFKSTVYSALSNVFCKNFLLVWSFSFYSLSKCLLQSRRNIFNCYAVEYFSFFLSWIVLLSCI